MLGLHKNKVIITVVNTVCVFLWTRLENNLPTKFYFAATYSMVAGSGVVKAGRGWACARPKYMFVPLAHMANGLAYSRCPTNTNDLAMTLVPGFNHR